MMKLAEIYKVDRQPRPRRSSAPPTRRIRARRTCPRRRRSAWAARSCCSPRFPGALSWNTGSIRAQTRAKFRELGWRKIVAFQTRNPTHRAHEYIQKAALEICDGLLLHPLVGETKGDDVPAAVRMETYKVLLDLYYPKDRAMLTVMPAHMRYGGPREAILHAIIRRNYGCTHFIVGRDHAGVGTYYGTYDAQKIFERFAPGGDRHHPAQLREHLLLQALRRDGVVQDLPAHDADRLLLSGTKVREMLRAGRVAAARVHPPGDSGHPGARDARGRLTA